MKSSNGRLTKAKEVDLRNVITIAGQETGSNYIHGYCPFHEGNGENSKSKSFLVYANHYLCLSPKCEEHGDIVNWFNFKLNGNPRASLKDGAFNRILDTILGTDYAKMPVSQPTVVEHTEEDYANLKKLALACHQELLETPKRMTYYLSRGFTLQTVKRQWWGWDGKRYTIPIWQGIPGKRLVALRYRARPGDEEEYTRYSGVRDFNVKSLYNREALLVAKKYKTPLIVMYGEFDAQLSFQYRVPTVSPTNGALSFQVEWLEGFAGDVIFVPDRGEEKAAYADANQIGSQAWVVQMPKGHYKDFTELVKVEGNPRKLWHQIFEFTGIRFFMRTHMRRWRSEHPL